MSAPTYDIRTVADFLKVPEDRIDECLREFRIMLDMARATTSLLDTIADTMADEPNAKHKRGDVHFVMLDRFEWIDDNLGQAHLTIDGRGESRTRIPCKSCCPANAQFPSPRQPHPVTPEKVILFLGTFSAQARRMLVHIVRVHCNDGELWTD